MKHLKSFGFLCICLLALCGCNNQETPLLKGTIQLDGYTDIALNYSPLGCSVMSSPIYIEPDSLTGEYTVDIEDYKGHGPCELLIDDKIYGVYLEQDRTLTLNISQKDGEYVLEFEGENAEISEYTSQMYKLFDIMLYSPMDESEQLPIDECFSLLDENYAKLKQMLSTIQDEDRRAYMAEETDYQYMSMKYLLLGDRAGQENVDIKSYPEAAEILQKVDANSPHALSSNMLFRWVFAQVDDIEAAEGDLSGKCIAAMDLIDAQITNTNAKQLMVNYLPQYFFSYGDHTTGVEEFWTRYCEFAKEYPDVIKSFEAEKNKEVKDMDGQHLPDLTLTAPDGSQVQLSSLLPNAKITYVDVWATWCGPCCKEIPHLEKLVEKMKDNKDVQFLSFSVDSDLEAWKSKLEKDNPQWAQYVLDGANNEVLSNALNITGIPRFFILDSQGNVVDQDTKRPSNEELQGYLESLCAN